ncbi:D-alanyl-D-alanine carboxypeptidase family protein [Actinoplanes oblitus]|uniref:D-alanyl-D-alanine carboxypeptidase family protein n=1 Tax=Actinoplanes oblitus TaxID=3040509 RepID=A0ABY8WBG6_9ACTN|nr:D-alanyl-D-alanine carboxypeptidase family protein [Actinoplanes oblitus]WIM94471.1 D-alanyl-D-alanine carboxypeptidase family protein [Actinoplanes oblitus]
MSRIRTARTTTRETTGPGVVGLAAVALVLGILVSLSAGFTGVSIGDLVHGRGGPVAEGDGGLPDSATVFDDRYPGVANLDPELLHALRAAAADAARAGVTFQVSSGWRARAYQERLLREAKVKYGSEREAARWVAPADKSAHVAGHAVDLVSSDGGAWLAAHGAGYGLCQIYRNEPWHHELRAAAIEHGCPAMYADASEDPRMR